MVTDEKLLKEYVTTKHDCVFDQLALRHRDKIHKMILRRIGNEADAEDLTQEVFVRAFKSIHTFKNNAKFSTWLYRITTNVIYSFVVQTKEKYELCEQLPEKIDRHASPIETIVEKETYEEIIEAVAMLAPKLRTTLQMIALEGHSFTTIAKKEGCAEATIYWRVHQARKLLKEALEGKAKLR